MDKKKFFLGLVICIVLSLGIVLITLIATKYDKQNNTNSAQTQEGSNGEEVNVISTSTQLKVTDDESETYTNFDAKINLSDLSSTGNSVNISGKTIKISNSGVYYFSGSASDASVVVEATKDDDIVLVFDNASIKSTSTSAINVVKAKLVTISLVNGTTNTFEDASSYTDLNEDEEPDGAIFSKADLKITGSGTLKVTANYKDGIVSKDTLTVIDSTVFVTSADDGIRGKDFVMLKNAKVTVNSKGDGIKSTNDSDESLGYVLVHGGSASISSEADGIQAEHIINISNSEITIKTTGEVNNTHQENFGRPSENNVQNSTSESDSSSSKGLKSGKEITINGGTISISSTDDAIHSNYFVIVNDGKIALSAGDDGIHADTNIIINGGNIDVTKAYEGIEANYVEINDGKISVVASDDGININGGNDQSGMEFGRGGFSNVNNGNRKLVINNGTIYVKSNGDGLDANGSIELNGGNVTVAGTTSNGNSALDYDNTFNVNGGSIVYYGATGMWQNPSNTSKQYSVCFSCSGKSGDEIVLKDSNGNTVASVKTENSYGAVTFSNTNLKQGETYMLYVNGTSSGSQQISSIVTSTLQTGGMNGEPMNNRQMQPDQMRENGSANLEIPTGMQENMGRQQNKR